MNKLTIEQKQEIIKLYGIGVKVSKLVDQFNVARSSINRILFLYKTSWWRNIF